MRQTAILLTGIALLAACSGEPTAANSATDTIARIGGETKHHSAQP